jgi:hypothetical protein
MAEPLNILLADRDGHRARRRRRLPRLRALLAAGLAIHFGYLEPARGFDWLGEPIVLVALSVATLTEIAAYYVPGVDHALDLIGAPGRRDRGHRRGSRGHGRAARLAALAHRDRRGRRDRDAGHALNAVGRAKTGALPEASESGVLDGGACRLGPASVLAFLLPVIALIAVAASGLRAATLAPARV